MNTLKSFEACIHLLSVVDDILEGLTAHPDYGTEIWHLTQKTGDTRIEVFKFYEKLVADEKNGKRI